MSPELIDPERFGFKSSRPTKNSDCYALGMVVYETITGRFPFYQHGDLTVFVKVLAGERPTREVRFTEDLWKMMESCWAHQPNNRPGVEDVLQCLEKTTDFSSSLRMDEEIEKGDDHLDFDDLPCMFVFSFLPSTFHSLSAFHGDNHRDSN